MSLLLAMSVPSHFVIVVMNMSGKMGTNLAPSARLDAKVTKVLACASMLLLRFWS